MKPNRFENLNIVGRSKLFYAISLFLLAATIILTLVIGVDVDIQFKGGTMLKYGYTGTVDHEAAAKVIEDSIDSTVIITEGEGIGDAGKFLQISVNSTAGLTVDVQQEITKSLNVEFTDNNIELLESSDVNPSTGLAFFRKCLVAVGFAFLVLIIYIAFRFRRIGGWSAGVMAIVALLHDVMMVYFAFVVFRIPIDANFIAVVLTILGFSINDTIVIYDRIRENRKLYGKTMSIGDLVNKSIGQSFTRSLNTSICTTSAMIVISIVGISYGVDSIFSFALPMIIGMISGVYSTLCIAGPLWVLWQEHKERKQPTKGKTTKAKA